ncbi:glycerol-3-phosphate responsive antiterminator [Fictibacillus sp. Mic-4]|uniref:glycerol-3-phosphate responsive antiterminator n=1 Tax=Fictibacillus TaxID=1329200 RepID=UPI00040D2E46|nr:glycerol-3-phosphate responsive antiterminator [Fictibacillus gelatini]
MSFSGQTILPAVRTIKDLEKLFQSKYQYIVLLDTHVGRIKTIIQLAKQHGKSIFLHLDLIHGLKADEYATEFICQEAKPAGIISTRSNVILAAKKKGVIAIQRLFLLDSIALETSYKILKKTQPDYIEVLPGVMPHIIKEIKEETGIPIFAGGLIRSKRDVEMALQSGAIAVTTSKSELWF